MVKKKPKACLVTFTSCFGCSFEFLNLKERMFKIFSTVDFIDFKLVGREEEKEYDIVFVEGAITTEREVEKIKKLRGRTKVLVALGACACNGCVLTVRNYRRNAERQVYGKNLYKSVDIKPIDAYVKVDYYLRGCPFNKEELWDFLTSWVIGKNWREKSCVVCVECRKLETDCFLKNGIVCLGAISRAGCNAICPYNEFPCVGCRGIAPDSNVEKFLEVLKRMGLKKEEIEEKLQIYNLLKEIGEKDGRN